MIRRMLFLVLAVLFLAVPAASAQPYGQTGITTSAPLIPGTVVEVRACCYVPGSQVLLFISTGEGDQQGQSDVTDLEEEKGLLVRAARTQASSELSAIAGPDGVAVFQVAVPADAEYGTVTLVAYGQQPLPGTPQTNTQQADVVPAAGPGGVVPGVGGLPVTGANETSLPIALIAVVLLAGGGAALLISRRRDNDDLASTGNGSSSS
jgi:LPXTG-motif cell wall-anchored protein